MDGLGYSFRDEKILSTALTHSSYANENHCECNERLEFLGDAVLSIIISEYLFKKMPSVSEGELSKIRASLVCEQSLADFSRELKLGDSLLLGKGEDATGGRDRTSILSDAFEALLAAIYLDSDIYVATEWVVKIMEPMLELALKGKTYHDHKTILQEYVQKSGKKIVYEIISETGPEHHKDFEIEVRINGKRIATGHGLSKKDAEQSAAKSALAELGHAIL